MRSWWGDEGGVTSIEYALIASLIAVVIVVTLQAVGTDVFGLYNKLADGMNGAGM